MKLFQTMTTVIPVAFIYSSTFGVQLDATQTASCQMLAGIALSDGTITDAEIVDAGSYVRPETRSRPAAADQLFRVLPAFCRVAATLRPSDDSDIKVEIWMPVEKDIWNKKFQAVGNGAFTGSIRYISMARALARGYATSSTNTGHTGNTASFGLGHPEKVIDFGWRSVHEMTILAKHVISGYYDTPPEYSYWNGCSAGGRQGMKEAQRFPDDFDGIIAGAPGLDWTGRAAAAIRAEQFFEMNPTAKLSPAQRNLVHEAVLTTCDANDNIIDGIISEPERCLPDFAQLQCKENSDDLCLSRIQIAAVRMLYASPANPATGRPITGLMPGSELGWTELGWTASARATGLEQFRYLVFADPEWTIDRFNFETDIARAEEMDQNSLNALDPNLQPFFDSGGKLLQYHGWSDPQISPANTTQYYERVLDTIGTHELIHDSYRLFMAPGMAHCGGGNGPNTFDMLTTLEDWVENGNAPDFIVASKQRDGAIELTRPLCPYPQIAIYKGTGSTQRAENFTCQMP